MAKSQELTNWNDVEITTLEAMSFQDMMDAGVISIDEIDDTVAVDQDKLIGVPFILFDVEIKESNTYGGTYALCKVKTQDGTRVFADGGTGIQTQLKRYQEITRLQGRPTMLPIYFKKGLRVSEYTTEVDGKMIPASTFYFDNDMD